MAFDHASHNHSTAEAKLACETARRLSHLNARAPVMVGIVRTDAKGDSEPCVSAIGNMTDLAHMALALIETALSSPRPTDCIACMTNYDKLARARGELTTMVGNC